MPAGALLVHGYTGAPGDLAPLAERISALPERPEVVTVRLPGHEGPGAPEFLPDAFVASIADAADRFARAGIRFVVVGHSTGGTLALAAVHAAGIDPRLLVLVSSPNRVDWESLERWKRHSAGAPGLSLPSTARMVSFVNAIGSQPVPDRFPVLLLQGERDMLVPCGDAAAWRPRFAGPVRTVYVPGAGHDPFRGDGAPFALDLLTRAIGDALHEESPEETGSILGLAAVEPSLDRFLAQSPHSARHLAAAPSATALAGGTPALPPVVATEPVIANIEVTTRCNLRCPFCARTGSGRPDADMSPALFARILDLLPHAWRVTLVGLGEPLLHPDLPVLVSAAAARGRRVSVATNATHLSPDLSRRLVDAGLSGIAFSLDSVDPDAAARLRPGTPIDAVLSNIRAFGEIADATRPIPRAVFTAVSTQSAPFLVQLVETVSTLGVDALMLSDLNFEENLGRTLWKHGDDATKGRVRDAIRTAFERKLPVLSVGALEAFGLSERYRDHLLIPPGRLYDRPARRQSCLSPWQTVPVAVDGTVTLCDCRPDAPLGKLTATPFGEIWNGDALRAHRAAMTGGTPPAKCAGCPRF